MINQVHEIEISSRVFEQTELTTLFIKALCALTELNYLTANVKGQEEKQKIDALMHNIAVNKLDVRLVSREY